MILEDDGMELLVDRLTLDLAGVSEADGRRLPRLVAEYLASADVSGVPQHAGRLRLSLAADPGESLPALAERIARELLDALGRSS
jgi:hypothetical protein